MKTPQSLFALLLLLAYIPGSQAQSPYGGPCATSNELQSRPGKYFTADQYPWPAVRAEYFKKLTTPAEKATAKQTLAKMEKLEQQSRSDLAPEGGSWESSYSSEGYQYLGDNRLADYRLQIGFHNYICVQNKIKRNGEYSTVLRVFVNNIRLNTLSKYLDNISYGGSMSDDKYGHKDWKTYKPGVASPKIKLFTFLECNNANLIDVINSGKGYWQDVPEKEIRKNTFDIVYRYWFIKKMDIPILLPVSRKEYLESLLEFYEREQLYLPQSNNYEQNSASARQTYFGDIPAVLANKKAIVNKILKENSADWLSRQAVVNRQEDDYQNQKQKLPRYSSDFTFRKFYDDEKGARPLYKYNPAYFAATKPNKAEPELLTIAFRYVPMPAHLKLVNNFTQQFDTRAWSALLMPAGK